MYLKDVETRDLYKARTALCGEGAKILAFSGEVSQKQPSQGQGQNIPEGEKYLNREFVFS